MKPLSPLLRSPPLPSRAAIVAVLARREAVSLMRGMAFYVALSLAIVAAIWVLLVDVRALEGAGILVVADPFRPPLTAALLVLALFIAVSAAVSLARDRESGVLEVLFYGPVDEPAYILGKLAGGLAVWLAALPLILAVFFILSLMTGFLLTPPVVLGLAVSLVPAAAILAFGILIAIGADRVRSAVLVLVAVIAVLLGVAILYRMVLLMPVDDPSSPLLALRDTLAALDVGLRWASPFAYLERIVDAAAAGAWRPAAVNLVIAVAGAAIMLGLAALWLRRRGVHRREA